MQCIHTYKLTAAVAALIENGKKLKIFYTYSSQFSIMKGEICIAQSLALNIKRILILGMQSMSILWCSGKYHSI